MTRATAPLRAALLALLIGAVALGAPAASFAGASSPEGEPATTTGAASTTTTTTTPTAPEAPPPLIQAERPQRASRSGSAAKRRAGKRATNAPGTESAATGGVRARQRAPGVGGLQIRTPSLPLDLRSSIAGVPAFFIESFQIPPFLLPIFQAAGTTYGIPWQVLAAINEVETDYGRDLSVSSAGAEGWMQFLPAEWTQYGVDANGDGFKDPYNPADAIFAAARYLRAAGGARSIKAAVYAYNHSQAYVESVMLRAQLLGGTPPELLGAITGLTEARFPVHAPSHYSDGFPTISTGVARAGATTNTLVGTTIYSQAGAPVIAVQDGEVVQIGDSPSLGHFVVLRDAYGNTYVYAQLGDVAPVYPVLQPHVHSALSDRIARRAGEAEPAPSGPATAGAQPRSPLSEGAAVSGLALGAAAILEPAPPVPVRGSPPSPPPVGDNPVAPAVHTPAPSKAHAHVRVFTEGANDVYLHPLLPGVEVIQGTVLGHVGSGSGSGSGSGGSGSGGSSTTGSSPMSEGSPHMLFQIRPAGVRAPLIDPKPILDGWVALEDSSIFRAKGENPFLATSPTVGQVLLESKQQLEPQVLHDGGIRLGACARHDVQEGRVDKRVLATLEYLSVSGLRPTVSGLPCAGSTTTTTAAAAANIPASASSVALAITAVNGIPIAGHQGPGSIADATVRKLLMLQGLSRPRRIVSLMSYPGAAGAFARPSAADAIHVAFAALGSASAHASLFGAGLTPSEWIELIDRLGQIPDPTVGSGHSSAAIPDAAPAPATSGEGAAGGQH